MKHLKEEKDFITLILTRGATYEDKLRIVELYRKYIDPTLGKVQITNSSCSSCNTSINTYWTKVKDYFQKNEGLFVN